MKKNYILLILTLWNVTLFAQLTYVPDNQFEDYLENHGWGNGVYLDDYVTTANIASVTYININYKDIFSLTGIEDFAALQGLSCDNNNLTQIDLSNNTNLTELRISQNQLTSLDVSQNPLLTSLYVSNNQLTSLDVSQNPLLTSLYVSNNQLTSADLRNGTNQNIVNMYLNNNPDLVCIYVDDPAYSEANWTHIDSTAFFVDSEATCQYYLQETYIPDVNFETYLEQSGFGNGSLDQVVPTYKITDLTELDIAGKNIVDLTGIQDFAALTYLKCNNNAIQSLDVSENVHLEQLETYNNNLNQINLPVTSTLHELIVSNNNLTALDISANSNLETLLCSNNQLTTLNIDNNVGLIYLDACFNQLESLNLSNNVVLSSCDLDGNKLTFLDLSPTPVTILNCADNQLTSIDLRILNTGNLDYVRLMGNTALECVYVNDIAYAQSNYTLVEATVIFVANEAECDYYHQLTFIPDENFEQELIDLSYDDVLDNNVLTHRIDGITNLNLQNLTINDLTGIQDFAALTYLNCDNNSLINLDLSNNANLTYLHCNNNSLINLDLSNNANLQTLTCHGNALETLLLSPSAAISSIDCSNNYLISIDLPQNTALMQLTIYNNQIQSLNISFATQLTSLHCNMNDINAIDVSNNLNLDNLYCGNNPFLTSLDVSLVSNLMDLQCDHCNLDYLNVQNGNNEAGMMFSALQNPNLTCIYVDNAAFSTESWSCSIDLNATFVENEAQCEFLNDHTFVPDDAFEQALIEYGYDTVLDDYVLTSEINIMETLDISNRGIVNLKGIEDFFALSEINASNNLLNNTDLTNNTSLTMLNFSNNRLYRANLKNGSNLQFSSINFLNNPNLTCIYVDEVAYCTNSFSDIDLQTHFVLDEDQCQFFLTHIFIPDDNFELALIDQGYDEVIDHYVLKSEVSGLNELIVDNYNIYDLTGIEGFTSLMGLDCHANQISSLDLSRNIYLWGLDCHSNALISLDLSSNTLLRGLDCHDNQLEILDIRNGNNNQITNNYFDSRGNSNLTCIYVDDVTYSETTWTQVDATSHFVHNENECESYLSVSDLEDAETIVYGPNPVREYLQIQSDMVIRNVSVYNQFGQEVFNKIIDNQQAVINFSTFESGLYFVKINKTHTFKVIKE